MQVERHDEVLAATSHLPHLLAFGLVDSLAKRNENLEIFRYAAGGFRDFTRIAGSDPVMWHDIFLANREAVLRTLDTFRSDLDALRDAVDAGDGHQLLGVFTRARVAREHFSKILARRAYMETAVNTDDLTFIASPGGRLSGRIRVPGDKSISHRALIFGLLSVGRTTIEGLLEGEDVLRTAAACRALGAVVTREGQGAGGGAWSVRGVGIGGLRQPAGPLDFGNAGTGARLMMGVAGSHPIETLFDGDASLRRRPMRRILDPLLLMGAQVVGEAAGGRLPLTLRGPRDCLPLDYETPVPSAQVKSAVLLAGLNAPGRTSVTEREATRDHTERMLRAFGAEVAVEAHGPHGRRVTLTGQPELRPAAITVPRRRSRLAPLSAPRAASAGPARARAKRAARITAGLGGG